MTTDQFDTLWEDCEPEREPDGEARRCLDCESLILHSNSMYCTACEADYAVLAHENTGSYFNPIAGEMIEPEVVPDYYIPAPGEVVRKMPTCGAQRQAWKEMGHFCILPVGHRGECACIPDGLTT